MKTRWAALIAAALLAPGLVDKAYATGQPVKTVEHLAFARESATEQGTRFHLVKVVCAPSSRAYIYVCNFGGTASGKPICAATYVHYHPGHTGRTYRVNFFNETWRCGTPPPIAPPAYPGDQGGPPS